jgi:F0F1-type ATP synthase assembly protein I
MSNNRIPPEFARYGGAGIQMVLIIGLFVFIGTRLDRRFATEKPWWTLGLSIFGVIIALIFMIRSFDNIARDNARRKKAAQRKDPKNKD